MTLRAHSVWRSPDGQYEVALEEECFEAMVRLARRHYPSEVGTSLAGSYSDDGHRAIVTRLAPLTEDSHGARTTFRRGARGLLGFFRDLFNSTRGQVHYVGEWHSHPDGQPLPSPTDNESVMAIARDPKSLCPECVSIVLAIDGRDTSLGVFIYSRTCGRSALRRDHSRETR